MSTGQEQPQSLSGAEPSDGSQAVSSDHAPESAVEAQTASKPAAVPAGPLNLAMLRSLRSGGAPASSKGDESSVPAKPVPAPPPTATAIAAAGSVGAAAASSEPAEGESPKPRGGGTGGGGRTGGGRPGGGRGPGRPGGSKKPDDAPPMRAPKPTAAIPSMKELDEELDALLGGADLDQLFATSGGAAPATPLESGGQVQATVVKVHGDDVFVSLGGPHEGILSLIQFPADAPPEPGQTLEVNIRGLNADEGLYELSLPGQKISVIDWSDLQEGEMVEARVEAVNTGGLQCLVGAANVPAFIPISQIAEYRVEDASTFVGEKLVCLITEANPARGNLVLSRRAVLQREREAMREQRLAELEPGAVVEGVVRKLTDFGAFVDLGGLDGLIHISQLSWERVKHPSEVLTEGERVQVKVEKIDPQTAKISLSYRALQDHPWENIEERFPVGSTLTGTVSRIANFGAFVRLESGVEGLVHISELSNRRVANVASVVKEGDSVEVKVLEVDPEAQRMSLSIKAALPVSDSDASGEPAAEDTTPPPAPLVPQRSEPLRGGNDRPTGGEQFGLKW